MPKEHVETYRIEPSRVAGLKEAIAQLSVGAKRHGLGPITVRILDESEAASTVAIATPTPALGQYQPLARIEHLKNGRVSITPLTRRRIDFSAIRSERAAQKCEACGVRRKRRLTYLLEGRQGQVQVGSTCLGSYVGESDPRKALHQADVFAKARELVEAATVDAEPVRPGRTPHPTVPTVDAFLEHVAAVVREEGRFVPLSEAPVGDNSASAALAIANYRLEQTGETGGEGEANWIPVTPEDRARASELASSFRSSIDAKPSPAGYERRLRNLLDKDFAWPAYQGILATLFFVPADPVGVRDRNERRGEARGEWIGEVGDPVDLEVTVDRVFTAVKSRYGEQVPHLLIDDEGHVLSWFATNKHLEVGSRYRLEGEIRSRRKFRRDFITVVTNCSVTEL